MQILFSLKMEKKHCSDSVPSAEQAEQSEHSCSARILAEF